MNPTTAESNSLLLPPPPHHAQPHRQSTSCERHPNEHFSGFCPSCLCERLSVLDQNTPPSPSPSHGQKASGIRAIFRPSAPRKSSCSSSSNNNNNIPSSSSGLGTELRRSKSFSASRNNGEGISSGLFEPQRKSCDVRGRSTICSLISLGEERNGNAEAGRRSFVGVRGEVLEEEEVEWIGDDKVVTENVGEEDGIVSEERNVGGIAAEERVAEPEIVEEVEECRKEGSLWGEEERSMKDHMEFDSQVKKSSGRDFKDIAGSVWSAASVFSKKWQKWRRKQKTKKQERGGRSVMLPVVKPAGRHFRETQSEVADYGFGRRSCDTDPRFSLDAARFSLDVARMSLDDTRRSFEMPRASWDGHTIGRSSFQRMPTIASVVEDSPPSVRVPRTDMQIPIEMPAGTNSVDEDEATPGGSAQTRDYYLDSSSRRRKSLDRSNSTMKTAAAVVTEMDELQTIKNAKVTPSMADHDLHGTRKVIVGDKESPRDPIPTLNNSNSLRDDCSETFDLAFRENGSVIDNGDPKGTSSKKSRRWGKGWNIWGFIHRRTGGGHSKAFENDGGYGRSNGLVDRSYSESWQDFRAGEPNGCNRRVLRSNSSVSYRDCSYPFGGPPLVDTRRNSFDTNGKKKRDELILERNHRSGRHSPTKGVDNVGMPRLSVTPNGNRRGMVGGSFKGSSRATATPHAQSIARSTLRLY